jgi:hypothetical protein
VRTASAQSQRTGAIAPCSWTPEESQVESCEHQDNANIHCQPFPESVSEEHEIYTDYDGCHRHHVKHDSYLSAHDTVLLHSGASVINTLINAAETGQVQYCYDMYLKHAASLGFR